MAFKRIPTTTRFTRRAAGAPSRSAPDQAPGNTQGRPGTASDAGLPARKDSPLPSRPLWL